MAKTRKGEGIEGIQDELNWHGKALGSLADVKIAGIKKNMVAEFDTVTGVGINTREVINDAKPVCNDPIKLSAGPEYAATDKVSYFGIYVVRWPQGYQGFSIEIKFQLRICGNKIGRSPWILNTLLRLIIKSYVHMQELLY